MEDHSVALVMFASTSDIITGIKIHLVFGKLDISIFGFSTYRICGDH